MFYIVLSSVLAIVVVFILIRWLLKSRPKPPEDTISKMESWETNMLERKPPIREKTPRRAAHNGKKIDPVGESMHRMVDPASTSCEVSHAETPSDCSPGGDSSAP